MNIYSVSSRSHPAAHVLVEFGDDDIAGTVLLIIGCTGDGDRRSFGFTDTDHIDADTLLFSALSSSNGVVLMVFAIGDKNDGTSDSLVFFPETTDAGIDCRPYSGALRSD